MTRFFYLDGRIVDAESPLMVFEKLRQQESLPPPTVGRFLELIQSRASLGFGIRVDVGERSDELETRCRRALASLMNHGWLRRRSGTALAAVR